MSYQPLPGTGDNMFQQYNPFSGNLNDPRVQITETTELGTVYSVGSGQLTRIAVVDAHSQWRFFLAHGYLTTYPEQDN